MPYAAVVNSYPVKDLGANPERPPEYVLVVIKETECTKGNNTSFTVPRLATLVRVDCVKTAGTATVVQPRLDGLLPDGTTTTVVWQTLIAASIVRDCAVAPYLATAEVLTHYSEPDAGADNAITTAYYFKRGW